MSGWQIMKAKKGEVHSERKNDQVVDLKFYPYLRNLPFFLAMGHVDICYQGKVISYGSYDPHSERLSWHGWRWCFV